MLPIITEGKAKGDYRCIQERMMTSLFFHGSGGGKNNDVIIRSWCILKVSKQLRDLIECNNLYVYSHDSQCASKLNPLHPVAAK